MQTTGNHSDLSRSASSKSRVYFDVEGYGHSRLTTFCAICLKPGILQDEVNEIKENIKKLKQIVTSDGLTEKTHTEVLRRFTEYLKSEDNLRVFLGGTTRNEKNKRFYRSCLTLNKKLNKYTSNNYQLIAPLKKEMPSFKNSYYPVDLKNPTSTKKELRLSYKTLMKKAFGDVRYFSDKDELGLFSWLAKQLNLAYNKHLKYDIIDPEKNVTNPKVLAAINGTLPYFISSDFASKNICLFDGEVGPIRRFYYDKKKRSKKKFPKKGDKE